MSAFGIGVPELLLIFVIALIVFGPGKLPEIGAGVGRAIREFKRATSEITAEFTREMDATNEPSHSESKPDSKGEGDHTTTS